MIIVKTPLRISYVGGGSDLKDFYTVTPGRVISSSINKFIYVIIKKRFDRKIYINYSAPPKSPAGGLKNKSWKRKCTKRLT